MIRIGILKSEDGWEKHYIHACEELKVQYQVIDIASNDWYQQIVDSGVDGLLVRPSGRNEQLKQLYCERFYFVEHELHIPMYPSYFSVLLYENKRMQHYWMMINGISHARTWIFYERNSALDFFRTYNQYPLVCKPNLGGKAEGVRVLKNARHSAMLLNKLFTRFKFHNPGLYRWRKYRHLFRYPVMELIGTLKNQSAS